MTFIESIQSHKGGLLRLKTCLYWYGSGYDKNPERICLILDVDGTVVGVDAFLITTAATRSTRHASATAAALLLVDGSPQRIWIAKEDVELL